MDHAGVTTVTKETLDLSTSPAAELAAAAQRASGNAVLELGTAAFVIVAVPGNLVAEAEELVAAALDAGVDGA